MANLKPTKNTTSSPVSTPFENKESISGAFGSAYTSFRPNRQFMTDEHEPATSGFQYIFMTTPPLNLTSANLTHLGLNGARGKIENKLKKLLTCFPNGEPFMQVLSNKFLRTSLEDEILEAKAAYNTYAGKSVKYAQSAEAGRFDKEFVVEYEETDELFITLLHKIWFEYASSAARGLIQRSAESLRRNYIDYAASAYVFNTKPDGRTITFWSKYTGVFPKANNFSALTGGTAGEIVHVSIPYAASKVEHFDLNILGDFQDVASAKSSFNLLADRKEIETRAQLTSFERVDLNQAQQVTSPNNGMVLTKSESYTESFGERPPEFAALDNFAQPSASTNSVDSIPTKSSTPSGLDISLDAYRSTQNVKLIKEVDSGGDSHFVLDFY